MSSGRWQRTVTATAETWKIYGIYHLLPGSNLETKKKTIFPYYLILDLLWSWELVLVSRSAHTFSLKHLTLTEFVPNSPFSPAISPISHFLILNTPHTLRSVNISAFLHTHTHTLLRLKTACTEEQYLSSHTLIILLKFSRFLVILQRIAKDGDCDNKKWNTCK